MKTENQDFSQMKKNTVEAKCQLKETDFVKFDNKDGNGVRIMFIGNSITLHDVKEDIGWHGCHGMAASEKSKDYVHLLEAMSLKADENASFCTCQVFLWERACNGCDDTLHHFEGAREFCPDIMVFRAVENCSGDVDINIFKENLDKLISYLDKNNKAKVIMTTGFWHHPLDKGLVEYAEEKGMPVVHLGDLGEKDEMKALGLFEHSGVANHPGDLGMANIAERIGKVLVPMIKETV